MANKSNRNHVSWSRLAYRPAPLAVAGAALFSTGSLGTGTHRKPVPPPEKPVPIQYVLKIDEPSKERLAANSRPFTSLKKSEPAAQLAPEPKLEHLTAVQIPVTRGEQQQTVNLAAAADVKKPVRPAVDVAPGDAAPAHDGGAPILPTSDLLVQPGQSRLLEFKAIRRIAVGDPKIADVAPVSQTEVLVTAKGAGETTLFVWDARGRHTYRVIVSAPATPAPPPPPDYGAIAGKLREVINDSGIRVTAVGDTIFLEGSVSSALTAQRAELLAQAMAPKVRNLIQVQAPAPVPVPAGPSASELMARILNEALASTGISARSLNPTTVVVQGTVAPADAERVRRIIGAVDKSVSVVDALQVLARAPRQIIIRSRVVDINRGRLRDLGVDFGQVQQTGSGASRQATVTDQPFLFGVTGGLFSNPSLNPLQAIGVRLHLLEEQNAARILSEPNLMVLEGSKGNILVGGELPIPVVQNTGGVALAPTVTIMFKEFGVRLAVEPQTVADNGEITMRVQPEVSLLDFSNAIQISGFNIPALRTRREDSVIRVNAGQTLAIGGLIENNYSRVVRKIPGLGDIPVLGQFFRSRNFQRDESELVILLTPEIVNPGESPKVTDIAREAPNYPIKRPDVPPGVRPDQPGGPFGDPKNPDRKSRKK